MIASKRQRKLKWCEPDPWTPEDSMRRLGMAIEKWVGTPYVPGQQRPGQGVDCVRFVEAVLEELYDFKDSPNPELLKVSQDASVHDPRTVTAVTQELLKRYPHTIERGDEVYPGDVVICRVGKGPGHSVIVGPRPWTCYHAMPTAGVCMGGVGSIPDVVRVIHLLEKERWASKR